MNTLIFHVSGTHCPACKILIEDILSEQIGIQNVFVDLKRKIVTIDTELDNTPEEIAEMLNEKIMHNGYSLSIDKVTKEKKSEVI